MSAALRHTCIRASAGTGKTHQLVNRYLALLLLQAMGAGRIAPDRLVAVTFTRKGAGEFTERILRRLAEAAGNGGRLERLRADLVLLVKGNPECGLGGLAPGVDLAVDAAVLQRALAATIDEFDRLALGTIDSLMARSVQTLAFELGLGGFEILEEAARQRQREVLLGEAFQRASQRGLEVFFQTLKKATLKSPSSLREALDGFVDEYHEWIELIPEAEAWGGSGIWGDALPKPPATDWRAQAAALADQVAGHDFGHKIAARSISKALRWLSERRPWTAVSSVPAWIDEGGILTTLWRAWPEQEGTFLFQNKVRTIPVRFMVPLKGILEAWIAAECEALSQQTAAIHHLVSDYEQVYDQVARRNGRLDYGDLPILLNEGRDAGPPREAIQLLAFRWYQQFDHWMLDEFQDTSRVQWEVLKPWLDEAIQDTGGEKSVFVVGDPKQSIYGWRGGEPRLFDELEGWYPTAFDVQIMAKSWRSRPSVLELANRVCSPASNPALQDPAQFSPAARERWRYETHAPEASRQAHPGYAAVLVAAESDANEAEGNGEAGDDGGGDAGDSRADRLAPQAKVIKAVIGRLNPLGKGLSCAILVRKRANGEAIAQWLRAHGVPQVMVEGAATLAVQSPVVATLVDALRWLAVPGNTLAEGHLQMTPLWVVLKDATRPNDDGSVPAGSVWRHWQQQVAEKGAAAVTREWCERLAAANPDAYAQYCLREVGQAAQLAGTGVALPEWLDTLGQLTVPETASAGSIHVMTIHKAKGLEFDVVFLPDLDQALGGRNRVLIKRDAQGHPVGVLATPRKWLRAWVPTLEGLHDAQQAEEDLEALCVLYVALTRAQEATFLILNGGKVRGSPRTRGWIQQAVGDPSTQNPLSPSPWGEGEVLWEHGSPDLVAGKAQAQATAAAPAPLPRLGTPVPRRVRRRPSDAGHEVFATTAPGTAASNEGQQFGTAMHAVFEQVEWWTGAGRLEGDEDAVALVRRCLETPDIKDLFTRHADGDQAHCELPLEFIEGNTWWSGILDRLVLRCDPSGALLCAQVIDFKTDRVEGIEVLRERYATQLAVYHRAVATALALPQDRVELVLVSTHLGKTLRL